MDHNYKVISIISKTINQGTPLNTKVLPKPFPWVPGTENCIFKICNKLLVFQY